MTVSSAASRRIWRLVPPAVLVTVGLLLFPSAGHDDTHITCWPAYTLSHVGQILNYNGDRVEQSSSLLQVLLLAALHKVTRIDVLTLAKLSSMAFGIGTLLALFTLVARSADRSAGLFAALIASVSIPIVYWSFSGMETSLVSFAGLCLLVSSADFIAGHPAAALWKPTVALTAFALVRPETPLVAACVLVGSLVVVAVGGSADSVDAANGRTRRVSLLLLMLALACGSLVFFRWNYFGALVPQPATAKFSGISVARLVEGLHYFKRHAWTPGRATMIVSATIVVGVAFAAVRQLRTSTLNLYVVLSLLFVGASASSVVIAGGDWMEGGRFLAHFLPAAIGLGAMGLSGSVAGRRALPIVAAALIALEARSAFVFTLSESPSLPLWADVTTDLDRVGRDFSWFERHNRINVRDMPLLEHLDEAITRLTRQQSEPITLVSGQMGIVAYHLAQRHFGRIRFLDRFGLIDRSLTNCAVTHDAPRDTGGLVIVLETYLRQLPALEQTCHIERPDLMYSLGDFSSLDAYGYQTIYAQRGRVEALGTRLAGAPVIADSFFAVDAALVRSSGSFPIEHVDLGGAAEAWTPR